MLHSNIFTLAMPSHHLHSPPLSLFPQPVPRDGIIFIHSFTLTFISDSISFRLPLLLTPSAPLIIPVMFIELQANISSVLQSSRISIESCDWSQSHEVVKEQWYLDDHHISQLSHSEPSRRWCRPVYRTNIGTTQITNQTKNQHQHMRRGDALQ